MPGTVVYEVADEVVQRWWKTDRVVAEAQMGAVGVGMDPVDGEHRDAADGLGVEQHEKPGDPVDGVEGVVVEQSANEVPTLSWAWEYPAMHGAVWAGRLMAVAWPRRTAQVTNGLAPWRLVGPLASQSSMSVCRALPMVVSRVRSQVSSAMAVAGPTPAADRAGLRSVRASMPGSSGHRYR